MVDTRIQERNGEGAFPISGAQASLMAFEGRQNLTGTSLTQIKRGLARAWRLVMTSRRRSRNHFAPRLSCFVRLASLSRTTASPPSRSPYRI